MESFQLSLFSGEIPDENLKKDLKVVTPKLPITKEEIKVPILPKNACFEDKEIFEYYNAFKTIQAPTIEEKSNFISKLKQTASICKKCALHEGRTNSVFSDGNFDAPILLIGEAPGENEDLSGIPFVGKAGQLLTKILESVDISREKDVYIINTVKCRPAGNRKPEVKEMEACSTYLLKQIEVSSAKIVLLAGASAISAVLKKTEPISKIRGEWIEWNGKIVMPIFHPSYLLRNPSKEEGKPKWLMWQDIKKVKNKLDELRGNI